jgi:hypothetical protein
LRRSVKERIFGETDDGQKRDNQRFRRIARGQIVDELSIAKNRI